MPNTVLRDGIHDILFILSYTFVSFHFIHFFNLTTKTIFYYYSPGRIARFMVRMRFKFQFKILFIHKFVVCVLCTQSLSQYGEYELEVSVWCSIHFELAHLIE